jgi:hypothetical protein
VTCGIMTVTGIKEVTGCHRPNCPDLTPLGGSSFEIIQGMDAHQYGRGRANRPFEIGEPGSGVARFWSANRREQGLPERTHVEYH